MAKSKILSADGVSSISSGVQLLDGNVSTVPKVKAVIPCGCQVLVETLTVQELAGTTIAISEKTELKVPLQGYIRAVGPNFKSTDWGFNVGDRVLISGGGVLAPNYDDSERDRFFMEPHAIKSVLIEDK